MGRLRRSNKWTMIRCAAVLMICAINGKMVDRILAYGEVWSVDLVDDLGEKKRKTRQGTGE